MNIGNLGRTLAQMLPAASRKLLRMRGTTHESPEYQPSFPVQPSKQIFGSGTPPRRARPFGQRTFIPISFAEKTRERDARLTLAGEEPRNRTRSPSSEPSLVSAESTHIGRLLPFRNIGLTPTENAEAGYTRTK